MLRIDGAAYPRKASAVIATPPALLSPAATPLARERRRVGNTSVAYASTAASSALIPAVGIASGSFKSACWRARALPASLCRFVGIHSWKP